MGILLTVVVVVAVFWYLASAALKEAVFECRRPYVLKRALLARLIEEGWRPGLVLAYLWVEEQFAQEPRYAVPWGRSLWRGYEEKAWEAFEERVGPARMAVICEGLGRWRADPFAPALKEWFWGQIKGGA